MTTAVQSRNIALDNDRFQHAAKEVLGRLSNISSIAITDSNEQTVTASKELTALLGAVIGAVAEGNAISVQVLPEELTTGTAAEYLGVSRQAVVKMIQREELRAHMVGTHRRVLLADVRELKHARRERQRAALDKMRNLDEELEQY